VEAAGAFGELKASAPSPKAVAAEATIEAGKTILCTFVPELILFVIQRLVYQCLHGARVRNVIFRNGYATES
jgi:hypothetical protein